jgi:hypothetical protein
LVIDEATRRERARELRAMLIATLEAGALAPTPALTVAGPSNQPTKKA